ncbi:DNA-processing protein DprA [Sinorhizobium alkalisoli]|uniref:DNA-processing protein DprA n=1 Tax=Sinorhizobium alkalisoli TaxID=1752398 RepID=UPI001FE63758|nr:DNA-processing protein DprA [Sinorhizobium alkalisoli]
MQVDNQPDLTSEKIAFLSLAMMKGVGFHTLWQIAESKLSFQSVFYSQGEELSELLKSKGARLPSTSNADWDGIRKALAESVDQLRAVFEASKIRIAFRSDKCYPRTLLHLDDPPHWLFVQGNAEILSAPSIAIVGTRDPSPDGLWLAEYVGLTLKHWGHPTVSGLALGIDQAIHNASLTAKVPTIAVLGTGITADYPKNIGPLRKKIVESGGAVITEYLPGESYSAMNFVRRNRLQAALARALIPVEWKERSGTAHTVRYAAGLGRAIAGLRLPTWDHRQISLPGGQGPRQVFTVPGQDEAFRAFVERSLRDDHLYRQASFL